MCVRSSIAFYGSFNLDMGAFGPPLPFTAASTWTWIDHPVSGLHILTLALLRLGFPTAPHLWCLTVPVSTTRRTVLQKVRGSSNNEVPQLVNTGFQVLFHSPPGVLFTFPSQYYAHTGFQVLFHSPPGVLFTFPSQYYTLSVTEEYLALRGGPRLFPQGFPCLVVLWILPCHPPGVLFTFPSQYYTLSVTEEYLALRGGPRLFPQGFPCLVVLWILPCHLGFHVRGFHPLWPAFPKPFHYP